MTLDHFVSSLTFQCDHYHSVPPEALYFSGPWADPHLNFSEISSVKAEDNFPCVTFTRCKWHIMLSALCPLVTHSLIFLFNNAWQCILEAILLNKNLKSLL